MEGRGKKQHWRRWDEKFLPNKSVTQLKNAWRRCLALIWNRHRQANSLKILVIQPKKIVNKQHERKSKRKHNLLIKKKKKKKKNIEIERERESVCERDRVREWEISKGKRKKLPSFLGLNLCLNKQDSQIGNNGTMIKIAAKENKD